MTGGTRIQLARQRHCREHGVVSRAVGEDLVEVTSPLQGTVVGVRVGPGDCAAPGASSRFVDTW